MASFNRKVGSTFETYRPEDARLVGELRLLIGREHDRLLADPLADGLETARALSELVDAVVRAWFDAASSGGNLALLALGGYGRGELSPRSDIDLMVLFHPDSSQAASDLAGRLVGFLWDLGFVVGHSARSPDDCREAMMSDLPSATAILEGRLLSGSRVLFNRLGERVVEPWRRERGGTFIKKKIEEVRARHRFYGGSPLLSIPNVKESAGGLRDLHVAGWIALALTGRRDFRVYREAGILTDESRGEILGACSRIHRIRHVLHRLGGNKQDVLDFTVRAQCAGQLCVKNGEGLRGVERLMRAYYRDARTLHRFLNAVIRTQEGCPLGPAARATGGGLTEVGGEAYPEGPFADPLAALKAVSSAAGLGLENSPELVVAVAATVGGIDDAFRSDPGVARVFLDLLSLDGAARALRTLEMAGFLGEYLPEFGRLSCLVREEPHHQYTVDEHTLRAVEALDGAADEGSARRTELGRVRRRDLLRLSLLLHDIGKARGADHVTRGVEMLPEATRRLRLTEDEARIVRFHVEKHLRMTELADRLTPREAAVTLAREVPDPDLLRSLWLHTLADIEAAGRGALSGWRETQITSLYERAMAALSPVPALPLLDRVVREAGEERTEEVRAHLAQMGNRYSLEVEPSRVLLHLDLVRTARRRPAVLSYLPAETHGEVWVGARDAPGLFARIAGVLAIHALDIRGAQAYTRRDGFALNRYFVTMAGVAPPEDPIYWKAVAGDLIRAEEGDLDLSSRMDRHRGRYRPEAPEGPPGPPPGATASNRISEKYTVVEVTTRDRPALLYDLARTISDHGYSIHHAVVATRGAIVLDSFYLSRPDGGRPGEEEVVPLLAALTQLSSDEP